MEKIAEQITEVTATLEALLTERARQIVQAANDGEPQASIARRYGITRARVGQLVDHFKRIDEAAKDGQDA